MKKTIKLFALTLICSIYVGTAVAANSNPNSNAPAASSNTNTNAETTPKPKSLVSVLQDLQKAGYIVKSADYDKDGNKYKVDAVDRHGDKQSFDVNAITGLTSDQKKQPHETSIVEAVKKVEKNGATVTSVEQNTDSYTVKTVDNNNNEQKYTIDLKSGNVTKS